jgi:hypothetical protein
MKRILLIGGLMACAAAALAAGTVTSTETRFQLVRKVVFAWTANSSGAASGSTTHACTGELLRVSVIPGTGTAAPSDNYDIELHDENDIDLLDGNGANLDSATTYTFLVSDTLGVVSNEDIELSITNAGASNTGTVLVYLR